MRTWQQSWPLDWSPKSPPLGLSILKGETEKPTENSREKTK
jgi:hypothetical protein